MLGGPSRKRTTRQQENMWGANAEREKKFARWPRSSQRELQTIVAEHYKQMNGDAHVVITKLPAGIALAGWVPDFVKNPILLGAEPSPAKKSEQIATRRREHTRRYRAKRIAEKPASLSRMKLAGGSRREP